MSDFAATAFPKVPRPMWEFDEGLNAAGGEDGVLFYMDDYEEVPVSSFAPGIASLVNSHDTLDNIEKIRSKAEFNGGEFLSCAHRYTFSYLIILHTDV